MDSEYDYLFKIILIGDSGVGKSCLTTRFTKNTFNSNFQPTIGVQFVTREIELNRKTVKLQIWDTAGQERYHTITRAHYRGAHGAIVVFDTTKQESFDNVTKWIEDVEQYTDPNVKKILIGNKCDLTTERVIDYAKVKEYADTLNVSYLETSAKNSTSVRDAFITLAMEIMSQWSSTSPTTPNIDVRAREKPVKTSCQFC